MSKPFSTLGATSARSGAKVSGGLLLFLVLAVVGGIALFTHGVCPVVGLPIAVLGALVVDRALFGARR